MNPQNEHTCIQADALRVFCDVYERIRSIQPFDRRIKIAKRITTKQILNNCHCYRCQDACYLIESMNFHTNE
jgi:hypothetical protein